MTSREIADVVQKRHDNVKRTIETLAEKGLVRFTQSEETSHDGAGARPVEIYLVDERDSYVVVAQLSPEFTARLVDYWQTHRNQRPMTTAEMFLQNAQILVDIQYQQAKNHQAITVIDAKVDRIEAAQTVMSARPTNAESIVHIRERIWKMFGLSDSVVNEVMRQSPLAPKPAGAVRNAHVDAENSTYTVWWQKDVTATFRRFVDECSQATATMCTHPYIEGRFRLLKATK
jgi:phage regulator Rha-like protein